MIAGHFPEMVMVKVLLRDRPSADNSCNVLTIGLKLIVLANLDTA